MSAAEAEFVRDLERDGRLAAHLESERARLRRLLETPWMQAGAKARFGYLDGAKEVAIEAATEPHPHLRITFIPTDRPNLRIAHGIPLVDAAGDRIEDPLGDLQEALDTSDLRRSRQLSPPDAAGYRWISLE